MWGSRGIAPLILSNCQLHLPDLNNRVKKFPVPIDKEVGWPKSTRFLDKNFDESDENWCEKCFKMKDNLEVLINELNLPS